jgi:hypothetical protein
VALPPRTTREPNRKSWCDASTMIISYLAENRGAVLLRENTDTRFAKSHENTDAKFLPVRQNKGSYLL